MPSRRMLFPMVALLGVTLSCWGFPSGASAQSARVVGPTPPRLAFVDGEVSFWRSGAEDWTPAQINTALAVGDAVYVADAGNAEVEIGARAYVRAGSGTEVQIESLEVGYLQLSVRFGHVAVDLKRHPEGQVIEVDTPNGAFVIDRAGYYRLDVDDETTTFTTRHDGQARVVPAGGESIEVPSDRQIVLRGTDPATMSGSAAPGDDAWDRWNYERTAQLGERPLSAEYVPPDVAGLDDLDRYGDWRATPAYGQVWVPRGVPVGWAPYSTGRWVWDGYYGWTWVDYAPWGWAPYHYGRWCWVDGFWGWAPGPLVVQPVYAPALVAFFGGSEVGVSVTVGVPFVSWVALGWGEPVVPWWGPTGFVGRPYWGGWGGPHVVNNVVVNNTTIVHVHDIHHFDNFRHRHAVMGVDGEHFGRGGADYTHVDHERRRGLRPMHGDLGVRPGRTSLAPREGHAVRPPDRWRTRQVIATRPPQDPARQPHAAGLVPRDAPRQVPPRVVSGSGPEVREPQGERPHAGHHVSTPEIERGPRFEPGHEAGGRATPPGQAESPGTRLRGHAPEDRTLREMRGTRVAPPSTVERARPWDRPRSNLGRLPQAAPKPPVTDEKPRNSRRSTPTREQPVPKPPATGGPSGIEQGNVGRRTYRTDMGTVPRPPQHQQEKAPAEIPARNVPGQDLGSRNIAPGRGGDGHRGRGRSELMPDAPRAVAPPVQAAPPSGGRHFGSMGAEQGSPQGRPFGAPQGSAPRGEGGVRGLGQGHGGP